MFVFSKTDVIYQNPIKIILPSGLIIKIFIKGDCFLRKTIRKTESVM